MSWRRLVGALLLGLVALVVTMTAALAAHALTSTSPEASITVTLPVLAAAALLAVGLHELSHAAAFRALGGRPTFGWRSWTTFGPVLYVASPGCYYSRGGVLFAGVGAVLVLGALLIGVGTLAPTGTPAPAIPGSAPRAPAAAGRAGRSER